MLHFKSINLIFSLIFIFISFNVSAQEYNVVVEQDLKFEKLLNEKIKSNTTNNLNERYKIQIFSGDNLNSRKMLNEFKSKYNSIDATIIFQTPNYKVIVGGFFNRITAFHCLEQLKDDYPNSFVIKPSK